MDIDDLKSEQEKSRRERELCEDILNNLNVQFELLRYVALPQILAEACGDKALQGLKAEFNILDPVRFRSSLPGSSDSLTGLQLPVRFDECSG